MVDDILTLSKLDSNSFGDRKIRLSLRDFLEEQTEILEGMADREGKTIRFVDADNAFDEKACLIEADPELLIRIFQNVASNGIRYAERKVLVRMDCLEEGIQVFVEDDGPGIAGEDLPHVFDRDYHSPNGRFGLGLAIAKAGMEYLSGTISVQNKKAPQHGASFCLAFPRGAGIKRVYKK